MNLIRFLILFAAAAFTAGPLVAQSQLAGAAGVSVYKKSDLAATAVLVATPASGSKVNIFGANISNPTSSTIYVQFFDAATAGAVTVGTTVANFWLAVPPYGVLDARATPGVPFTLGLVIAATTTPTGSSAIGTNIPTVIFYAN